MTRTDGLLMVLILAVFGLGWTSHCSLAAASGPAGMRILVPRWQTPRAPAVRGPAGRPGDVPEQVPALQDSIEPVMSWKDRAKRSGCLALGAVYWGTCGPDPLSDMRSRTLLYRDLGPRIRTPQRPGPFQQQVPGLPHQVPGAPRSPQR